MWGSETFATDVSSTSMNVASITEAAISRGLKRGRQDVFVGSEAMAATGYEPRARFSNKSPQAIARGGDRGEN